MQLNCSSDTIKDASKVECVNIYSMLVKMPTIAMLFACVDEWWGFCVAVLRPVLANYMLDT